MRTYQQSLERRQPREVPGSEVNAATACNSSSSNACPSRTSPFRSPKNARQEGWRAFLVRSSVHP